MSEEEDISMSNKPTKRSVPSEKPPAKIPELNRPTGEDKPEDFLVTAIDSEDELGTYDPELGEADTGETDLGVTETAPHFRAPKQ